MVKLSKEHEICCRCEFSIVCSDGNCILLEIMPNQRDGPAVITHESAQSSSDAVKVKAYVQHGGELPVLLQPLPLGVGAQGGGSGSSLPPNTTEKQRPLTQVQASGLCSSLSLALGL